jgi:hypothetical protein
MKHLIGIAVLLLFILVSIQYYVYGTQPTNFDMMLLLFLIYGNTDK